VTNSLPADVRDAADITTITQLVLRERESRDLSQWGDMHECFHPDSLVRLSWFTGSGPKFVDASKDMAERGVPAKHRLSPIRVKLSGQKALASLACIIDIPATIDAVEVMLGAHGRLLYRVEKRNDVWRIAGFDAVYVRDELTTSIPGQSFSIDPSALVGFRPSYRLLTYVLRKQGYDIGADLPGDDQPEGVAALMAEIDDWLNR
jgi:hypothetical protein